MRLGIVSDSHGYVEYTRPAIRMLKSLEVDAVLHCGDVGSPAVVELFAPWQTHFVQGNCDVDLDGLAAAAAEAGHAWHGLFGDLEFDGVRVALLHSHERERFRATLAAGQWQLVCYGHTHVAAVDRHGPTLAVNPGALYRAYPHSLAIVDLPSLATEIIRL